MNSYKQVHAQANNDNCHDCCLAGSNFKTHIDFTDVKMRENIQFRISETLPHIHVFFPQLVNIFTSKV